MPVTVIDMSIFDLISGSAGDDFILPGVQGDPLFDALLGPDRIIAGRGDDEVLADPDGAAADDIVSGNAGDDRLDGGGGDDRLIGGAGADMLFGGDGSDTADYRSSAQDLSGGRFDGVIVNLRDFAVGRGSLGDAEGDRLSGVENVIGSAFDDQLLGNGAANRLNGGAGDDDLRGGAGDDLIYGGDGNDFIHGGDGNDRLSGGDGADTFLYVLSLFQVVPLPDGGDVGFLVDPVDVGYHRIVDFDTSEDKIRTQEDGPGVTFDDLVFSEYSAASGSGTRVTITEHISVFLMGVDAGDLSEANFEFINT